MNKSPVIMGTSKLRMTLVLNLMVILLEIASLNALAMTGRKYD